VRSPIQRSLFYLLVVLPFLAAVPLYWYFIYLPAGTVSALRSIPVIRLSETVTLPPFLDRYFEFSVPLVVDALYGNEEELAAAAFVALCSDPRGARWLLENRFDGEVETEGTLRAALVLEWSSEGDAVAEKNNSGAFRSRYLRWKAGNRTGPFAIPLPSRIDAGTELATFEGAGSAPFLFALMKDKATPVPMVQALAVPLAKHCDDPSLLKEIHDLLIRNGLRTNAFLFFLQDRSSGMAFDVMAEDVRRRGAGSGSFALEYFIAHFDRRAADLLEPFLLPDLASEPVLRRAVRGLTESDQPWAAAWLYRVIAKWPDHVALAVLSPSSGWTQPYWKRYGAFLGMAGGSPSEEIRLAALEQTVHLDWLSGGLPCTPFGTPQAGPWASALETLRVVRRRAFIPDSERLLSARKAHQALRALEVQGKTGGRAPEEAAHLFLELLGRFRSTENDEEEARTALARYSGWVLVHGWAALAQYKLREGLLRVAGDEKEYTSVRAEAALWLSLGGADALVVKEGLELGAAEGASRRGFACAGALARLGFKQYEDDFLKAWEGKNPVACYRAFCEVPRLPPALMAKAMERLSAWSRAKNPRKSKTGRFVISCVLRVPPGDGEKAADAFLKEYGPGELPDYWALQAGVPAVPDGNPAVLQELVASMENPEPVPGPGGCAAYLLRLWTGRSMGFDPSLQNKAHLRAVAKRWKAWLDEKGASLKWDAGEGCFR